MYFRLLATKENENTEKIFQQTMIHENPYAYIKNSSKVSPKKFERELNKSLCFGRFVKRIPLIIVSAGPGPYPENMTIWMTEEKPDLDCINAPFGDFRIMGEVRYYRSIKAKKYGNVSIKESTWNELTTIWKETWNSFGSEFEKLDWNKIAKQLDLLPINIQINIKND